MLVKQDNRKHDFRVTCDECGSILDFCTPDLMERWSETTQGTCNQVWITTHFTGHVKCICGRLIEVYDFEKITNPGNKLIIEFYHCDEELKEKISKKLTTYLIGG